MVNDLIALINDLDDPTLTEFFDVDVSGLDRFVKPETDLLSLIMLAKARNQGLDTVFVDEERFFDRSFTRIKGNLVDGTGPFDGAFYIEFELAPVLLHDKTFILNDYSESMGFGVMLDTANFLNAMVGHYMKDTDIDDYVGWQGKGVGTVLQLADYINKMLTMPAPISKKQSKRFSFSDLYWILGAVVALLVGIGYGIYYICKPVVWLFRKINHWLHKPI
jgi:hypothetical protein